MKLGYAQEQSPAGIGSITETLKGRLEVTLAYLFGSWAKGTARENSDIDIAVLIDGAPGKTCRGSVQLELISELADDRVDLVILNDASPLLQHQVLKHGVKLFSRDRAKQVDYVYRAITRYLDTIHLRRVQDGIMHRHIKEGRFGRINSRHQRSVEEAQRLFEQAEEHS